MSQRNKSGLHW